MGLVKCLERGKEISDMAKSCPNCGRPLEVGQDTMSKSVIQSNDQQNAIPVKKKKGHGCLITVLIFIGGFCVALSQGIRESQGNSNNISGKYIDVSNEESEKIDSVLKECGLEGLKKIEHDELLDNAHMEGETGYRIEYNDSIDNVILYLDSDMEVYSLKYIDYELYANNSVLATLQDYTLTSKEMSDLEIQCEEKVKEVLKSPSTAKFPSILEWGFGKEKNIVTVQGYVDAQNSFGAEIRSTFQFIIDTDTNTIQSFIFDGQEMIQ